MPHSSPSFLFSAGSELVVLDATDLNRSHDGCGMNVNSENVYREALIAHRLPQGVGVVSLSHLALAFAQMAKQLRSENAPAEQQEAFQSAIARAAQSARHLTTAERTAVQDTLLTAFDGLPRRHSAMPVRADFLRQVRFPPATDYRAFT